MPVLDTGPIDNRRSPRTTQLSIRLFNSGRLPATAGVEVYLVSPAGDGFTNETIYQIRLVALSPFGQPGSGYTVDHVFANLDVFGVRIITSGQGGNDIAAVITEFTAEGQVVKKHVLTGEMAQIPELLFAYVPNPSDHTITVFDTGTHNVVTTISLPSGSGPIAAAITPDGTQAYIANLSANSVPVINTATNTILTTILLNDFSSPNGIGITPDGSRAYVTTLGVESVTVINTVTNTIMTTISSDDFDQPSAIAITPDGSRAYVVNTGNDTVSVIDTTTNTVSASINLPPVNAGFKLTH